MTVSGKKERLGPRGSAPRGHLLSENGGDERTEERYRQMVSWSDGSKMHQILMPRPATTTLQRGRPRCSTRRGLVEYMEDQRVRDDSRPPMSPTPRDRRLAWSVTSRREVTTNLSKVEGTATNYREQESALKSQRGTTLRGGSERLGPTNTGSTGDTRSFSKPVSQRVNEVD